VRAHELGELLPLYAGGDLDPTDRARVERALEDAPELRAELAEWEALEAELGGAFAPLGRDDLAELLPLEAGGDLEPDLSAQVAAALREHPELAGELDALRAVDGLLAGAYAPAAGAEAGGRLVVRVQCPFCHDELAGAAPVVRCALCATPHHEACWGQNRGCSLLGCLSTRSVAADAADQRTCDGCGEQTPAAAPFCAWCAQPLGSDEGLPLSARPSRRAPAAAKETPAAAPAPAAPPPAEDAPAAGGRVVRLGQGWRFAAAAALLLISGLSIGAMFGVQQRALIEGVALEGMRPHLERADRELPRLLAEVARAQRAYREEDLDADEAPDYAPDLLALEEGLAGLEPARRGEAFPRLTRVAWGEWFEVRLGRSPAAPEERFFALARCRFPTASRPAGEWAWFVNHDGVVSSLPARFQLDEDGCTFSGYELDALDQVLADLGPDLRAVLGVEHVARGEDVLRLHVASDRAVAVSDLPVAVLARLAEEGLGLELASPRGSRGYWGDELWTLALEAVRDRHLPALREVAGLESVAATGRRLELVAESEGCRPLVEAALPPALGRDVERVGGTLALSAAEDPDLGLGAIVDRYGPALEADPEVEDYYIRVHHAPGAEPSSFEATGEQTLCIVGPTWLAGLEGRLPGLFEEVDAGGWGITLGEPRPADGPGAEGGPR